MSTDCHPHAAFGCKKRVMLFAALLASIALVYTTGCNDEPSNAPQHLADTVSPTADDDLGSCCTQDQCHPNITEARCEMLGGNFALGVDCDDRDDCVTTGPATGACCYQDPQVMLNECTEPLNEPDCKKLGGEIFLGKTCNDPDVIEFCEHTKPTEHSCCLPSGTCDPNMDALKCREAGGSFSATEPCAQRMCNTVVPHDACCTPDGECTHNLSQNECEAQGGNYNVGGDCSDANVCGDINPPTVESCCYPDENRCVDGLDSVACLDGNGIYSDQLTCAERDCGDEIFTPSSCCTDYACTHAATEEVCLEQGGNYEPDVHCDDRIDCRPPTGACCTENDCISDTIESACSGEFSEGLHCDELTDCVIPEGSCCYDNTCENGVLKTTCIEDLNGVFDAQTPCEQRSCYDNNNPELGSCCVDGDCEGDLTHDDCADKGGTFDINYDCDERIDCHASSMPTTGSCCTDTGCEDEVESEDCLDQNGSFSGDLSCEVRSDCSDSNGDNDDDDDGDDDDGDVDSGDDKDDENGAVSNDVSATGGRIGSCNAGSLSQNAPLAYLLVLCALVGLRRKQQQHV